MSNHNLLSQIQHAIQYPSGHLDRFAAFGPTFEMAPDGESQPAAKAIARSIETPTIPNNPSVSTQFNARRFILGGKATFTLQGVSERYTFRTTRSDPDQNGRTVIFVAMLTGPDNTSDYTYVGLLDDRSGQLRLTRKSRYTADSRPVRAFNWAVGRIWAGRSIEPATLHHMGSCGRCGRALTVPASIESGFGPECLGKLGGE